MVKLDLTIRKYNIGTQKIDSSILMNYKIVIARFSIQDKFEKVWFFKETFLLADISIEVILEILFLNFFDIDIWFIEKELEWRRYLTAKVLPTTQRVRLIDKKEFAVVALDDSTKTFMVYFATLSTPVMQVYPSYPAQLELLPADQAPIEVPPEYLDYTDIFLFDLMMELFENTNINEHTIELIEGKQSPYRLIYSLWPVELETLKTYIETHLKTGFIQPFKSPADTLIFFDQKSDGSFCFYINYWGLNNLSIKNQYPLSLINKALDRLNRSSQAFYSIGPDQYLPQNKNPRRWWIEDYFSYPVRLFRYKRG